MTESETAPSATAPRAEPPVNGQRALRAIAREATTDQTADSAPADVTVGHRDRGWLADLLDQLTPPEPWQYRPASLQAMARYARRGGWTGPTGPVRRAGMWWFRLVALPATLVCHYTAWIVARPARAIVVAVLWAVLMQVPVLRAAADAVLPWSAWPIGGGNG